MQDKNFMNTQNEKKTKIGRMQDKNFMSSLSLTKKNSPQHLMFRDYGHHFWLYCRNGGLDIRFNYNFSLE